MAEPLALGAQPLLVARLHALGVLDERAQLGEARLGERGVRRQLLVPAPRGEQLAPRGARLRAARSCSSPQNRSSTSSWYDGRASRRCSNCPDIATTRSTAAATSSRAAARPHAYARVRPSPKTRRETSERVLVLGPQLARSSSSSSGRSSSASTYASSPAGPTNESSPFVAEQQPDRLREDRLPRAGLAGDRVQPGRELELGLADEDEVLDAQATQHRIECSEARRTATIGPSGHGWDVNVSR